MTHKRKEKNNWLHQQYSWPPTIATILQGLVGFGVAYFAFNSYSLGYGLSFIAGSIAGVGIGIGYNLLARHFDWQKLHWIDIALMGASWYP